MAVPLNYPYKCTDFQVRLYVVAKNTGKVLKTKYMSADTFYCFHHVNAYEDRGSVCDCNQTVSMQKMNSLHRMLAVRQTIHDGTQTLVHTVTVKPHLAVTLVKWSPTI